MKKSTKMISALILILLLLLPSTSIAESILDQKPGGPIGGNVLQGISAGEIEDAPMPDTPSDPEGTSGNTGTSSGFPDGSPLSLTSSETGINTNPEGSAQQGSSQSGGSHHSGEAGQGSGADGASGGADAADTAKDGSHGGSGKTDGAVTESHARGGVIIALIVGLAAVAAVLWLLVRKRKKNTQGD